jgi:hypothetical protein
MSRINLRVTHAQYVVGEGIPSPEFAPGISVKAGDIVERTTIEAAQQPHLEEWLQRGWLRPSPRDLQLVPGVTLTVGDNLIDREWLEFVLSKLPGLNAQLQDWIRAGWIEKTEEAA